MATRLVRNASYSVLTASRFIGGKAINITAMISDLRHTVGTTQILAPSTPNAPELTREGGVYTWFGNGNFDFSTETRFAGNQYFAVTPAVSASNQAPTISTPAGASPKPVSGGGDGHIGKG